MGEKLFANDVTDKALLSKIYKQFAHSEKKKKNNKIWHLASIQHIIVEKIYSFLYLPSD